VLISAKLFRVARANGECCRGWSRLLAGGERIGPNTVQTLLAKLEAAPLGRIAEIKTLKRIAFSSKKSRA